jgi:S1-C subfamily serine protease
LVITHIEKESPAYRQEWSIGEIITSLNGDKITGMQHLLKLIKESNDILKMKTELGTIGFFNNDLSNNNLKLKDPSMFLK